MISSLSLTLSYRRDDVSWCETRGWQEMWQGCDWPWWPLGEKQEGEDQLRCHHASMLSCRVRIRTRWIRQKRIWNFYLPDLFQTPQRTRGHRRTWRWGLIPQTEDADTRKRSHEEEMLSSWWPKPQRLQEMMELRWKFWEKEREWVFPLSNRQSRNQEKNGFMRVDEYADITSCPPSPIIPLSSPLPGWCLCGSSKSTSVISQRWYWSAHANVSKETSKRLSPNGGLLM